MEELTYIGACIPFTNPPPENGLGKFKVEWNNLTFVHRGYLVIADLNTYFSSAGTSDGKIASEEIIAPVIKLITSDLDTIVEQLNALQILANSEHLVSSLTYDRNPNGKLFKVYDRSTLQDTNWTLFHAVTNLEGANPLLVNKKLREWIEISKYVKLQDPDREHAFIPAPYIECSTLREAVDKALQIYNAKNILEDFLR